MSAVADACESVWPSYKGDCSGFVRAVCARLDVSIPLQDADGIIRYLSGIPAGVERLRSGAEAAQRAEAGALVIGGLRGVEHAPPRTRGHVVVVVDGPVAHGSYPTAYWGMLGGTGERRKTVNYAWREADRDNVSYFCMAS